MNWAPLISEIASGAVSLTMAIVNRQIAARKKRIATAVTPGGRCESSGMATRLAPRRQAQGIRSIRATPCQSVARWHTSYMNRLTLGDFELSIFSDGTYPLDGGAFFGVIPKVMWSRKVDADERNYVIAGLNSLLIRSDGPRTGKQTVL